MGLRSRALEGGGVLSGIYTRLLIAPDFRPHYGDFRVARVLRTPEMQLKRVNADEVFALLKDADSEVWRFITDNNTNNYPAVGSNLYHRGLLLDYLCLWTISPAGLF